MSPCGCVCEAKAREKASRHVLLQLCIGELHAAFCLVCRWEVEDSGRFLNLNPRCLMKPWTRQVSASLLLLSMDCFESIFCCPDWLSNPHAKEDPIDLRLEEFYNGTGSAIPFQRPAVAKLNAWACHAPMAHRWSAGSIVASTVLGTPSWSSTSLITSSWPKLKYWILEQVLLCHDFRILRMEILWPDFRSRWCDTKDGWNRSKFGPIEKFLMYYENIEREKVRGLETRRIALPIVVSFALPRQESHWKLEAACFFWLSRETCWRIVTNT